MSKNSRRRFFRKLQVFVKRNALALLIGFTTVLTFGVIALSAYYSLKGTPEPTLEVSNTNPIPDNVARPVNTTETIVFVDPLETVNISKSYAADHLLEDKTTGIWQTHQAIDFSAKEGDKVFAVYSGQIESVVNSMMDGTTITLKINDKLKVVYKSLSSNVMVESGVKVKAGDVIGEVSTNVTEKAEGVHLHLEVIEDGKLIDPNLYFSFGDK